MNTRLAAVALFATDIRDLISVADVMEDTELHMGPNGALIFCMEYAFIIAISHGLFTSC